MRIPGSWRRYARIGSIVIFGMLLLAIASYTLFYMMMSRADLLQWYLELGDIYARNDWPVIFFTDDVKRDGNFLAAGALLLAVAAILLMVKELRRVPSAHLFPEFQIQIKKNALPVVALIVGLCAFWVYGNSHIQMAYDEAFSAVFAADAHPFHALSYYMLPNNHIFFNIFNNLIGAELSNQVQSGRLISLFAYVGLGCILYFWFKRIVQNPWVAVAIVFAASSLLPVWGFSFQARGYMLLLLASWTAFISMQSYFESGRRFLLVILIASCFVGYATLPSFLYFHLSTVVFAIILQFQKKEFDWAYWQSQVWSGAVVFLFYIPALTFSGIAAFTENRFVRPSDVLHSDFARQFISQLPEYANYGIANVFNARGIAGPIIFLVPLILLPFARNRFVKQVGLFAIILFFISLLVIIAMKATPFYRTLIFHLQFGIVACFLLVIEGFQRISLSWVHRQKNIILMFGFSVLTLIQVNRNLAFFSYTLYYYDINGTHARLIEFFNHIPEKSVLAFSDEAFYFKILGRQKGYGMDTESVGNYYQIKLAREDLVLEGRTSDVVFEKDGYQLLLVSNKQ